VGATTRRCTGVGVYRTGEILVSVESIFDGTAARSGNSPRRIRPRCAMCELAIRNDGYHWRYPKGRPAWLERGAPGELDSGWMIAPSTLVEDGDNLLFYYGGSRLRSRLVYEQRLHAEDRYPAL